MLSPRPVLAHAVLLTSDPAAGAVLRVPPTAIHLFFSESVQPIAGGIIVVSPSGKRVNAGPATRSGARLDVGIRGSERGSFLVLWRVISADTHPSRGQFIFSVGHASPTAETGGGSSLGLILQVMSRWLHYAGYALGFGPVAFSVLVLAPLKLNRTPALNQRLQSVTAFGIVALLLAEPLALMAQTASLGAGPGIDPNLAADVLASSYGRVVAQRLGAAVLLWALVGALRDAAMPVSIAVLILGCALGAVDAEASHALSVVPAWLGVASDAIHVAAMGTWVGGLVTLLAVWRLSVVSEHRQHIVTTFGRIAAASLLLLGVSGTVMALQHFKMAESLLTTGYGGVFVMKQCGLLVALLIVFRSLRPALPRRPRWWAIEATMLAVILALAGALVSLPPPA
ncbi:MAG: hypothetical protein NVS4B2_05980 [Chloroflexota bacterium]